MAQGKLPSYRLQSYEWVSCWKCLQRCQGNSRVCQALGERQQHQSGEATFPVNHQRPKLMAQLAGVYTGRHVSQSLLWEGNKEEETWGKRESERARRRRRRQEWVPLQHAPCVRVLYSVCARVRVCVRVCVCVCVWQRGREREREERETARKKMEQKRRAK